MILESGGEGIRFKPRPVEGASCPTDVQIERLILDGQQRLTSLFQALRLSQPVATRDARGKGIRRWYYLDINQALASNADREEAIIGVPGDKVVRNFRGEPLSDYSTLDRECAAGMFPLRVVFDTTALHQWMMAYVGNDPATMPARLVRWNELTQNVIQGFQQYQVPLIVLKKETPKEAVCQVFEKVNTGGVSLSVFELLTATFAADDFNLREDWERRRLELRRLRLLESVESTDFLQGVSLLATRERREQAVAGGQKSDDAPGISCKRKEVLKLTLAEYRGWADALTKGFEQAGRSRDIQVEVSVRRSPRPVCGRRSDCLGYRGRVLEG